MVIKNIDKFIEEHDITKIFLDIDGVIFASCQTLVDILNKRNGTNYKGEDVLSWNFKEVAPNITSEEVEELFSDEEFFNLVKPINGALDFLKKYRKKIIIVTKAQPKNALNKHKWFLENDFEDIPIITLPLNISKGIIDMKEHHWYGKNLFIDDSTNNLLESNADYVIQFREYQDNRVRQWQKDWDYDVMYSWRCEE